MVSIIDQTGAELWRPHVHEARAEMHALAGEWSQAKEEFSRALDLFCKIGATGHARRIQERLEQDTIGKPYESGPIEARD